MTVTVGTSLCSVFEIGSASALKGRSLLEHLLSHSGQGHPYDTSSPVEAPGAQAMVPHNPLSMVSA